MKRSLAILAVAALLGCVAWVAWSPALAENSPNTRLLTGKVLDRSDSPVANAVVYLTNTRTRAVKTYIAQQDGSYRFPALALNVDYEVYAQFEGKKSDVKTLSQFDNRTQVKIDLKIDVK
jgi:hypothetical protein